MPYKGSGGIALFILNLSTRWRWMANFTPRSPCSRGSIPVPTVYEAGYAPYPVWTVVKNRNSLSPVGIRNTNYPVNW